MSISYGTRNFRLFRVDINNNPADGDEYVYYDEAHLFVRPADLKGKIVIPHAGHYTMVNFKACETSDGVDVGNVYGEVANVTTSVHGIILYRGKHYVASIEATSDYGRAELHGYARTLLGTECMSSICTYHSY